MTDRIIVTRIAVYAHHGLHPEEQRLGQRFYISLVCTLDLQPAGQLDDWNLTVCYGRLAEAVQAIATGRRFRLIEALAEAIAGEVLRAFPPVEAVVVKVEKPEAPIPLLLQGVAVEIERRRNG